MRHWMELRPGSDSIPPGPFRAELLNVERLEDHARHLAAEITVARDRAPAPRLLPPRRRQRPRPARGLPPARPGRAPRRADRRPPPSGCSTTSTWSRPRSREVRRDLPRAYYRELPKLASRELRGTRAHRTAMALELIAPQRRAARRRPARAASSSRTRRSRRSRSASSGPGRACSSSRSSRTCARLTDEIVASARRARPRPTALRRALETSSADAALPPLPDDAADAFVVAARCSACASSARASAPLRVAARGAARAARSRRSRTWCAPSTSARPSAQVSIGNSITSLRLCATMTGRASSSA